MSSNPYELRTPLQFKQLSVGQVRVGTAGGSNHQVEFYCRLVVTNALLGKGFDEKAHLGIGEQRGARKAISG